MKKSAIISALFMMMLVLTSFSTPSKIGGGKNPTHGTHILGGGKNPTTGTLSIGGGRNPNHGTQTLGGGKNPNQGTI
ncbi:hypothetical protein [Flavobacterium sp.]|jgi:hypothetical protein|uniref:hypothetical protein n=1 Tax=Flavobacterium sp. TaxID=239 RepID=UPI00391A719C